MNVTELARKLKITPDELKNALPEMGFDFGKRAIKIPDHMTERIIRSYQQYRRRKQMEEEERYFREMTEKKLSEIGGKDAAMELPAHMSVRQLSEILGLPVAKVISELMRNGIMATINQTIDYDIASIIANDLGYNVTKSNGSEESNVESASASERLKALLSDAKGGSDRPPVVVVMGHVDHGKTSLLDKVRETDVVASESGGITQHIGAYQVEVKTEDNPDGRKITFLDTPGHEAFKNMRSRGGQVADVAILIVAADDNVQPQTIESLDIIQKEALPFIVAINKIDKPEADIERVKASLAELNVVSEAYGGNVTMVPISAKSGEGIPQLLDMVLLTADMKNLKAHCDTPAIGTVIESNVSKKEGAVATVIVRAGVLKRGDMVIVGNVPGKIRTMKDHHGADVAEATPGQPVQILGLKDAPTVGEILHVAEDKKAIKEAMKKYELEKIKKQHVTAEVVQNELHVFLAGDVFGSVEAIEESLSDVTVGDKGKVTVSRSVVGSVTEAHVLEADALGAVIMAFKVEIPTDVQVLAREKDVFIGQYDVIYDLLEEAEKRLKETVVPEKTRKDIGKMKVRAIFRRGMKDMIVGGVVTEGAIRPHSIVAVYRGKKFVTRMRLETVQLGRETIREMTEGGECGVKLVGDPLVEEGDVLHAYIEEEIME